MSSPKNHADSTSPRPGMAAAVEAGLRALRSSLERMFAPQPVTVETASNGLDSIAALSGGVHSHGLGAAFEVGGPVTARLVLLANPGEDTQLASALLHRPWSSEMVIDHDGQAAFAEMANIAASSFLNGAAAQLGLKLVPSIPMLGTHPVQRVVRAMTVSADWAMTARFAVELPWGPASGTFVATLLSAGG